MGNVRLPKPTPLGWGVAAGIAIAAGVIAFLVLPSPIVAPVVGLLAAAAFVMAGPRPHAEAESVPEPAAGAATAVPAQRTAPIPTPMPVAAAVPAPGIAPAVAAAPAIAPGVAPGSLPADPLDQVSQLSAYLHEETAAYQPSYASQAPSLVARVPGQTLTVTEPDPLATAFVTPAEPTTMAAPLDGTAWRLGMDILPQSRSTALAVGNRLGSFRSAVVKARREAKPVKAVKAVKPVKPKPPPGKHRAS